jgi:hypothetical protein
MKRSPRIARCTPGVKPRLDPGKADVATRVRLKPLLPGLWRVTPRPTRLPNLRLLERQDCGAADDRGSRPAPP